MMAKDLKIIGAFDFDGTLTYRDTLLPFLKFTFGTKVLAKKFLPLLPRLASFPLGLISRQEAKELILTAFLQGLPLSTVEAWGRAFAKGKLPSLIRKEVYQTLKWHQEQGHTSVLISANLSFYLKPWGECEGFDAVLASELEVDHDGLVTGKLKGKNCWGEEKVRRLEVAFGKKEGYMLFAYGDSRGDKELLDFADYPCYK
jgi:phosphatidylglycerophosphatase C